MDEQQPASETELTTTNNNDEFTSDGPPTSPANDNPDSEHERDEQSLNKSGNSICETHHHHHKWLWLHSAFHCLVTIVVRLNVVVPTLKHIPSFLYIHILTHISTSFLLGNRRSWIPIRHILVGIWWRSCPNYRRCFICLLHCNTPFRLTRTRSKDIS